MDIDQETRTCIETFDKGDYRQSALQARGLLSSKDDYVVQLILLISLQRLGEAEEASREGTKLLAAVEGNSWAKKLVQITLGRTTLAEASASAKSPDQLCQVYYYAGARSFTEGRFDEAQDRFDSCLSVHSECPERTIAYFQLTTLASRTSKVSVYLSEKIKVLEQQARTSFDQGDSKEGLSYCDHSQSLLSKYIGQRHPAFFVRCLTNLGDICLAFGEATRALEFYMNAVRVNLSLVGNHHPDFALSEEKLASAWIGLGEYALAVPMLQLSLEIYRGTWGEKSDAYLACLSRLARLHLLRQKTDTAEALLRQALDIKMSMSQCGAQPTLELADACLDLKHYAPVEALYEEAVAGFRNSGNIYSEDYASALEGLSRTKMSSGSKHAAEGLLRIALAIHDRNLGKRSQRSQQVRSQLSALLDESIEKVTSPYPTEEMSNLPGEFLAHLYLRASIIGGMGQRDRAEANLKELIEHCRYDRLHDRTFIQSLLRLAEWHEQSGTLAAQKGEAGEPHYAQADQLVTEALRRHRAVGGADGLEGPLHGANRRLDRYLEKALVLRGVLSTARGQHKEAYNFHKQASEQRSRWRINESINQGRAIDDVASCVAVNRFKEAREALQRWAADDEKSLPLGDNEAPESALLSYMREFHDLMELALSFALCKKSGAAGRELVMDMLLRRKGIVADIMRMRAANSVGRIKRGKWGKHYTDQRNQHREWLARVNTRRVASILPADSVLVEFVRYRRINFKAATTSGEARWTLPRYLALILPANQPHKVGVLDLGDAAVIETEIAEWLRHMRKGGRPFGSVSAPAPADTDIKNALDPHTDLGLLSSTYSGSSVRALILDPVIRVTGTRVKRLIIAPEGALYLVPFQSLPGRSRGFVGEERQIRYVTTGRDLLRSRENVKTAASKAVVIADPDFDWRPDKEAPQISTELAGGKSRFDGLVFSQLTWTRQEGKEIAKLLGVKPWLGADAVKDRVMRLESPLVLHFATHGFFTSSPRPQDLEPTELLRQSGLALAGASNQVDADGSVHDGEGGILTAENVLGLNLAGTELVVLSACHSGSGEIRHGEGVFGLTRAFLIAGARTLVVSLWAVPDGETRELIGRFYEQLKKGYGVAEALDGAQMEIRKKRKHPFFWGAFVVFGDGSPLSLFKKS